MERLILVCFLVIVAGVQAGVMSVRGYYCRDPDTGKLHAANTTWASTSFCGSYTCKLKKRNTTDLKPMRQINITNDGGNLKIETFNSTKLIVKPKAFIASKNSIAEKVYLLKNNEKDGIQVDANIKNKAYHEGGVENDRYLSEPEIKALTDLLHVVKKSDLEAIVELYNLAQDIYKDIDVPADVKTAYDGKDVNGRPVGSFQPNFEYKPPSYWYEPLSHAKAKSLDISDSPHALPLLNGPNSIPDIPSSKITYPKDMQYEGSYVIPQLIQENLKRPNAYFKGQASSEDLRKLPYYYPMSSFQRMNSYINPFKEYAMRTPGPQGYQENLELHPNCKFAGNKADYTQSPKVMKRPFIIDSPKKQSTIHNHLEEIERKRQRSNNQLLYPFGIIPIQNINTTSLQQNNLNTNPMFVFDLYNKHHHIHVPSYVSAYLAQYPNAFLVTSTNVPEIKDVKSSEKKVIVEEEKQKPSWKTEDLTQSVIDDVKANMDNRVKLLPFPLRKMIKLEKVDKALSLDEFSRAKRFAMGKAEPSKTDKQEDFDVYIEKSTCNSDIEPGFFRMGNQSEPYPACCPQRINNDAEISR